MRPSPDGTLPTEGGLVLIVDDDRKSRHLLRCLLTAQGYAIIEAADGVEALRQVEELRPDVVLLDVMMPILDGYAVCRQLKRNAGTALLPVIMVTALHDRNDRLKGIEAGADDFLSKPIDSKELLLRTRNAVRTKKLHEALEESIRRLRELEELRDGLVHLVVHDLKNPLCGITMFLGFLAEGKVGALNDKQAECVGQVLTATQDIVELVNSLLDVSRLEEGALPLERGTVDLVELYHEAIGQLSAATVDKQVALGPAPETLSISCDGGLIRRVFINLIGNALDFTPRGGVVKVSMEKREDGPIEVRITDRGPGIPPEYHRKIFEKFGRVEAHREGKTYSTGLGLTFCKLAVEAHSGAIGVESEVGAGSTFWFTLPAKESG